MSACDFVCGATISAQTLDADCLQEELPLAIRRVRPYAAVQCAVHVLLGFCVRATTRTSSAGTPCLDIRYHKTSSGSDAGGSWLARHLRRGSDRSARSRRLRGEVVFLTASAIRRQFAERASRIPTGSLWSSLLKRSCMQPLKLR